MYRSRPIPCEVSFPMNSQRWLLLVVAVASAAGATFAMMATGRRRHRTKTAQMHEQKADLHSWENEGGNLAPVRVSSVSP
jgi:hypothetical protein